MPPTNLQLILAFLISAHTIILSSLTLIQSPLLKTAFLWLIFFYKSKDMFVVRKHHNFLSGIYRVFAEFDITSVSSSILSEEFTNTDQSVQSKHPCRASMLSADQTSSLCLKTFSFCRTVLYVGIRLAMLWSNDPRGGAAADL